MSDAWQQAARLWKHMGAPIRPGAEDLRVITERLQDPALQKAALRVVVLGATPEYHALPWPDDVVLTAADKSQLMLDAIWPGGDTLCADWTALPLADASVDFLLCDGGLCLQPWPQGQHALVTALARVLKPGGLLILRSFVQPAVPESIDTVLADLRAGRLADRNLARLRVWMAMQRSVAEGVSNVASWKLLGSAAPDVETLAKLMNTDADYLRVVLAKSDDRSFHFADEREISGMFCTEPGGFRLEEVRVPAYPYGACCPTHVLRRL